MAAGEELEAALQRGWSFDELEVYADHLLSKNDPRGDVVAIDLSPRPEQQTWVQRRRTALGAWLGNALALRAGHLVQHGFLHELRDGMFPLELLDSSAGTFLRGYTAWGRLRVKASLERLASRQRPWLSRLTIAYHGDVPIADALVRTLIKATPRLEEITIVGRMPFDAFPHPNVKRARLDTRCYPIEIDAVKMRVDVVEGAPGPRIEADDLELLMELVDLAPDCNQLYTHGAQFDEPLPALITRLAAAQLVELAGPVVRVASPGMRLELGDRALALDDLAARRGWIEPDRGYIQFDNLELHGTFVRRCLETLPVSARMHDTLLDYHRTWARAENAQVVVDPERVHGYAAAFNALLELRGLFPTNIGDAGEWEMAERLGTELVCERGAYFRQYGYYYNY
ncbi:MAG: hypothetical protein M4D80_34100 [Myxococcota bacterium]|nr:hypothetical protein [Myxococcota bacterium]